jgi:folate-binding protein YgfZ
MARSGVIHRERGVLQITGTERLRFLDGLLTNDMKSLRPGHCLYSALLDDRGRILGDMDVYDVGEGYLVDTSAGQRTNLLSHLSEARVSEDVTVTNRTPDFDRFTVVGARAPETVKAALGREPPATGAWLEHADAVVARMDPLGTPGFEILAAAPGDAWFANLHNAGAVGFGREVWEVLRIKAPIRDAISFTKGCYVGQEVVSRVTNLGRTRRSLVGLVVDSEIAPDRGSSVRHGGAKVGRVTSAAPTSGRSVALAYVQSDHTNPGTRLAVDVRGSEIPATVASPPPLT